MVREETDATENPTIANVNNDVETRQAAQDLDSSTIFDPAEDESAGDEIGPLLKIDFGGLCAFVTGELEEVSVGTSFAVIHVLMPEPYNSSVRDPRLCRHGRYLIFKAGDLEARVPENTEFYQCITLPLWQPPDGLDEFSWKRNINTLCIWDIDRCDLRIELLNDEGTVVTEGFGASFPVDNERAGLLDLSGFAGSPIKDYWLRQSNGMPGDLAEMFNGEGLLGARLLLDRGVMKSGDVVGGEWGLCKGESTMILKPSNCRFSDSAIHSVARQATQLKIRIRAYNYSSQSEQLLTLANDSGPVELSFSNLCPVRAEEVLVERDVLSFYELSEYPLELKERVVPCQPSRRDVTPERSFCPPVSFG